MLCVRGRHLSVSVDAIDAYIESKMDNEKIKSRCNRFGSEEPKNVEKVIVNLYQFKLFWSSSLDFIACLASDNDALFG